MEYIVPFGVCALQATTTSTNVHVSAHGPLNSQAASFWDSAHVLCCHAQFDR